MLVGGVADKLGNGYEALWIMLQALRLVRDEATQLHLEPIVGGSGFEFCFEVNGITQWHQCKRQVSGSTWTLSALNSTGYLGAVAEKWGNDNSLEFYFVSLDTAKPFSSLISKAKLVQTYPDFEDAVNANAEHVKALKGFKDLIGLNDYDCWRLLRQNFVEVISEDSIRERLHSEIRQIFHGSPDAIIGILREVLDSSLTHKLNPTTLRAALIEKGLKLRNAVLDPTAMEKLQQHNDAHKASFVGVGDDISPIPRVQSGMVVDKIVEDEKTKVVAVTGVAGSGKSDLLEQIAQQLHQQHVPCLQLRIDRYLDCMTPGELGDKIFGLDESPCRTLALMAPDKRAVIIVDQLDAISEAAGRHANAKDLIFSLMRDSELYPEVCVIIGCRSYDFDSDSRLATIAQGDRGIRLQVPLLDYSREAAPYLEQFGIDSGKLSKEQRELVRLPLNLTLMVELERNGGFSELGITSTPGLYQELLKRRDRQLAEENVGWTAIQPLGHLAHVMSDSEQLDVPKMLLDSFPRAVDRLVSMHLLVDVEGKLKFFHDSLFDYAFARSFASTGKSLLDWLLEREQILFRRTQIRQVLELMRGIRDPSYTNTLRSLLVDERVRPHIKIMIVRWMAANPDVSRDELAILIALDGDVNSDIPLVVRLGLVNTMFVQLLMESGELFSWLNSTNEQRQKFALWLLEVALPVHPDEVIEGLRAWHGGVEQKVSILLNWIPQTAARTNEPKFVEFCCDLIALAPAEWFSGDRLPKGIDTGAWAHKDCNRAARVYAAWLKRWFEVTATGTPFKTYGNNSDNGYWLNHIVENEPYIFANEMLPWLLEGMQRESQNTPKDKWSSPYHIEDRDDEFSQTSSENMFSLVRIALRRTAQTSTDQAKKLLLTLNPNIHLSALHLHLETIAETPDLTEFLIPLLEDPNLFSAGPVGIEWKSAAQAIATCWDRLSNEQKLALEKRILSFWPETKDAKEYLELLGGKATGSNQTYIINYLNDNGDQQRAILRTIGVDRLSAEAKNRLEELERKFRNRALPEAEGSHSGFVRPPIDADSARQMSLVNWLTAMEHYNDPSDRSSWKDGAFFGGAGQLALTLQVWCKDSPVKAIELLRQMPEGLYEGYYRAVIDGIREGSDDQSILTEAAHYSGTFRWVDAENPLPKMVRSYPELLNDDKIFQCLNDIALDNAQRPGPVLERSNRESKKLDDIIHRAEHVHFKGAISLQGQAIEALSLALPAVPKRVNAIVEIAQQLSNSPISKRIRCCLSYLASSLATIDPDRGISLLDSVSATSALPLATKAGINIVAWAVFQREKEGLLLLERMLASKDPRVIGSGIWILGQAAYFKDSEANKFEAYWRLSVCPKGGRSGSSRYIFET